MKRIKELLKDFRDKNKSTDYESKHNFKLLSSEEKDVYNPTAPFEFNGETFLLTRVEARDSEKSKVGFFIPLYNSNDKSWQEIDVLDLYLQDPFVTFIDSELILGGVETKHNDSLIDYRTVFYRGKSFADLHKFASGPWGMKDIRLKEIDNKILLLTRPQGKIGGRGTIGWNVIDSLDDLNVENINKATLLDDMFIKSEWGGANEIHILDAQTVGILGHIACFDEAGARHYYASAFKLNHKNGKHTDMKIIAERDNFAPGPSKREDLKDVIFSGGLIRHMNRATLYCGVSDCEVHSINIEDPFI